VSETQDVIEGVEGLIRRFCILPDSAYLPLATWTVATYLAHVFEAFPYLALLSPTKRRGKTRLLEVLELLCKAPWRGTSPTSAALYRMMVGMPTLLLDEVETLRGKHVSEGQQAILAVLNAGHRKGATVPRCEGPKSELRYFSVYGPKAFACIGSLPDTLGDRCICITMQRKTAKQLVTRFLHTRAKADSEDVCESLRAWAGEHDENVRAAYESMADLAFLTDRDADLWMPLFAVCAVAAPHRIEALKNCALVLTHAKAANDVEDSLPLRLLSDVRDVWPDEAPHLTSGSLIESLKSILDAPWADLGLTARKLSMQLRPFGATPRQVRMGSATYKGYLRSELTTAFDRYLLSADESRETCETTRMETT
jgi:hypothetical protein